MMAPLCLYAEIEHINLQRRFPVLRVENQLWIGTPAGLYRYNPDDDAFKRFSLPLSSQQIHQLYHENEWLWCVSDSGLAVLHVRLNEWLAFTTQNGLPANKINGLDIQEDFVWIATENGAARFDMLIEEWETIDSARGLRQQSVKDIRVLDDRVWMIGDSQFTEYDPNFEKWRYFPLEDSTISIIRAFQLGEELWLVCDLGLIRFNPHLQTRQRHFQTFLNRSNLIDLFVDDQQLWAITKLGIFTYEAGSAVWREFEGNSALISEPPLGGTVNSQQIWVLTGQHVMIWDRSQKSWEILDYAVGLAASRYESVYSDGSLDMLFKSELIDYRALPAGPWRAIPLPRQNGVSRLNGRRILANLFDNETGGYLALGAYRWMWEGTRVSWIQENLWQENLPAEIGAAQRLDIKSQLQLDSTRTVTGFYNNIDYSETMYGLRYKSRQDDLFQEMSWGDFHRAPGKIPFGETANLFGSTIWMQAGSKTSRFKRSQFTLKAHAGQVRSQKTFEVQYGAGNEFQRTFRDVDYLKNQFFAILDLDSSDTPESIEIYVDDLNPSNNTLNTLVRQTIAGVTGDFDLMKQTEEVYFNEQLNAIRFLRYVPSNYNIVVRYTLGGHAFESILQLNGSFSSALRNIYAIAGQKIIPYSFQLIIHEPGGIGMPLSRFRLDDDGDGRIDSRRVDFENGFLIFPDTEPFPSAVYDPNQPESVYELEVRFQTEFSLIQLTHTNLVRGSEILYLDGDPAAGGNDYVLDYTNGTLIFVREGLVNPDTRIEITYEYYIDQNEQVQSAQFNWSPSDQFYLQGDWLRMEQEHPDDIARDSVRNLINLHSEIRGCLRGVDAKLVPAVAFHPDESKLAAGYAEGLLSSEKFRLQGSAEHYSSTYQNLYRPQSAIGDIRDRWQYAATIDILSWLRFFRNWSKIQGYEKSDARAPSDLTSSIGFLIHKSRLPGWQFVYRKFETRTADESSEKRYFQNLWEYAFPEFLVEKLSFKQMRMEALLRFGNQSGRELYGTTAQNFWQGYLRVNSQLRERIQVNVFYRRNDLQDDSREAHPALMSRSERVLFDLSHEAWRLMQVNIRTESLLNQHYYRDSEYRNANVRQFSQINLRLSPGRLHRLFAPLFFEFNYNQTLSGLGMSASAAQNRLWHFIGNEAAGLGTVQHIRTFYIKNEIRPGTNWLIYNLLEFNRQRQGTGLNRIDSRYTRLSEKVDLKVGFKTRFIMQYRQFWQNLGYDRTQQYFEPSCWLEHRWIPGFQNNLNLLYRNRRNEDGNIADDSDHWECRYDLVWRKYDFFKIRRLELHQSFSGIHHRAHGVVVARNWQLASSSSLDIYPLHSMIIRLRLDQNQFIEEVLPGEDYGSTRFTLKFSLRL
ncbi:hypothetical protein JXJ21_03385 [candidate division KSB1 bacterium]|nr:hypothetical protein [candidate division KSB1 bacterium]